MELNFEVIEMQNWNISTHRTKILTNWEQRVGVKNWNIPIDRAQRVGVKKLKYTNR